MPIFTLMLNEPFLLKVPVTLHVGKKEVTETIEVWFRHITADEIGETQANDDLLDRVVDRVERCFPVVDKHGEELEGEQLLDTLKQHPAIQNALIGAWQEAVAKKNLRLT